MLPLQLAESPSTQSVLDPTTGWQLYNGCTEKQASPATPTGDPEPLEEFDKVSECGRQLSWYGCNFSKLRVDVLIFSGRTIQRDDCCLQEKLYKDRVMGTVYRRTTEVSVRDSRTANQESKKVRRLTLKHDVGRHEISMFLDSSLLVLPSIKSKRFLESIWNTDQNFKLKWRLSAWKTYSCSHSHKNSLCC